MKHITMSRGNATAYLSLWDEGTDPEGYAGYSYKFSMNRKNALSFEPQKASEIVSLLQTEHDTLDINYGLTGA
jgi:hypothetical protein